MNVRPLAEREVANLVALNNTGNESAFLFVTATGLGKGIMDATEPLRRYFSERGFHRYDDQAKGPDSKVIKPCQIVLNGSLVSTKVSLYRPVTKKGDPRLWIYGLTEHASADDVLALVLKSGKLFVFNLSQLEPVTDMVAESSFLDCIVGKINGAAEELVHLLREIAKKDIMGAVDADTAVGRAVETALGIDINSSKNPDFHGIELKAHREGRSADRSGLFAQVPDWELSPHKSFSTILDRFGYEREGVRKLYCTVSGKSPNSQGLILTVKDGRLQESFRDVTKGKDEPVCLWSLDRLHGRLLSKHPETFWLEVKPTRNGGREAFRITSAVHTSRPSTFHFDAMLESGDVTVDHMIKRGDRGVQEKGPQFKVEDKKRPQLFLGEQREYRFA
jgi:hypothetical protein